MAKIEDLLVPSLTLDEVAAPSTPSSTSVVVYAKSDGLVYSKDDAGTETLMSSGSASTTSTPPTFVGIGSSASGTGDVTPSIHASTATDDIMLLFVQSDNQTATAPAGWAQATPAAGIGTAGAAGGMRLSIFWKRHDGSEVDPTVADTTDHTLAQIMSIRGCPSSGDPFRNVGVTRKTTASTTGTGSAGATPADNCMVVQAFAHALDSASAVFSSWTNASLSTVTERIDVATADGNGGGIGVATGLLATAGPFVATTVTETSTTDVGVCFYLLPSGYLNRGQHVDRQVFLTAGFADTWTKPSGALWLEAVLVGGGASGSAGRNAATAAGGGGGGGGGWGNYRYNAGELPATLTVTAGAGGAATANSDGAASNAGVASSVAAAGVTIGFGAPGGAAGASASGSGGLGGNGGGSGTATASFTDAFGSQPGGGGTGGTTAAAGSPNRDFGGGAGAGGGTTQGASAGGNSFRGGGGGGGGRAAGTAGTGGGSIIAGQLAGGASTGANGADSPYTVFGGSGAAGGIAATGPGGTGGWPGGGGGGGGSQSGAQAGGKGGDGVVTITTWC